VGYTIEVLDDVRAQLAPDDAVLKEARERRDFVRRVAESFPGALRSFPSGSLAHATANCPIHQRDKGLDADSGLVLDRRSYPRIGPDSEAEEGPSPIVGDVHDYLVTKVRARYPRATLKITKRAILIEFHEPLPGGEDPTVDLIVALDRRQAPGLWIPNTEAERWDPSHPEKHTALFTAEPKQLRVVRAHAVRLAKAENKRKRGVVPPLCSFNLQTIGWMFVTSGMDDATALLALWESGAQDLQRRLTPDPARVSPPIKVADRDEAIRRLRYAAAQLETALEHDDDEARVIDALRPLWPDFVADKPGGATKARLAAKLRSGASLSVTRSGALAADSGLALKKSRSFGGQWRSN
jgi:hypothetical protein